VESCFAAKPASEEAKHFKAYNSKRRTYMLAAFYGKEDLNEVKEVTFGKCDQVCPECDSRFWMNEIVDRKPPGLTCCSYGRIKLPDICKFKRPSDEIVELYTGSSAKSKNFQSNILKYNKLFATSFIGGNFKNVGSTQHGLWSLQVNGEVKWLNHAFQDPGDASRGPNTGQLYFLDFTNDTAQNIQEQRLQGLQYHDDLIPENLQLLERFQRESNNFIRCFKFTAEIIRQEQEQAAALGVSVPDVVFVVNPKAPGTRATQVGDDYIQRLRSAGQFTINPCPDFVGAVFSGDLPPFTTMLCISQEFSKKMSDMVLRRFRPEPLMSKCTLCYILMVKKAGQFWQEGSVKLLQ